MLIIPTEKRFDWANTPFVLIVIVLLNVGIFLGYQTRDTAKFTYVVNHYIEPGYLTTEWAHYGEYIEAQKKALPEQSETLDDLLNTIKKHADDDNRFDMAYELLRDENFSEYLQKRFGPRAQTSETTLEFNAYQERLKEEQYHTEWITSREKARAELLATSSLKYGLIPNEASIITLFSHQFLHGGMMHLLSNMFFLLICGFAVEAAVGHLKFLGFYIVSGLGGGLLHLLLNLDSSTPLVGASGAISGVMAMYLAVFRLRKIEFFYWFFVIVGYFRAPALFILPFYIGAEIYNYVTNPYSTTAFMAHVGGFIIGATAILITPKFIPNTINNDYIEEDQSIKPEQESLAQIYAAIETYQFTRAYKLLNEHTEKFNQSLHTDILRFNLTVKYDAKAAAKAALAIIKHADIESRFLNKVRRILEQYPTLTHYVSLPELIRLGTQFIHTKSTLLHIKQAELLFIQAEKKIHDSKNSNAIQAGDSQRLCAFAGKLASYFEQKNNPKKQAFYRDCIQQYKEG